MKLRLIIIALFSLPFMAEAQFSPSEMYPFITQLEADRGSLELFYIIEGSPERRARLVTFYKDYTQKLEQLPFETFSTGGKVDYLLIKRELENELYLLTQEEKEAAQLTK